MVGLCGGFGINAKKGWHSALKKGVVCSHQQRLHNFHYDCCPSSVDIRASERSNRSAFMRIWVANV